MPQEPHSKTVSRQFAPRADAYLKSALHRQGPDLVQAKELVASLRPLCLLDVGCGGGHLGFALAPHTGEVVASDAAPAMLLTVQQEATRRKLANLVTVAATAEQLPFANGAFPLVASRYSAHHWRHLGRALHELRRVTQAGGHLLLIDVTASTPDGTPLEAVADTHLQSFELLRDRSHVRDHTTAEWQAALQAAGFPQLRQWHWPLQLRFAPWVERIGTPAPRVALLRTLLREAPAEVQQALAIEADGSFRVTTSLFLAS